MLHTVEREHAESWRFTITSLLCVFSVLCASGSLANQPYVQRPEVQAYIDELVQTHQFSRKALEGVFSRAKRQDRIIELMSRPAERRLVWHEYRKILVDEPRISQGVTFWREKSSGARTSRDHLWCAARNHRGHYRC